MRPAATWGVYLWSDARGTTAAHRDPVACWTGEVQARSARDAARVAAREWSKSDDLSDLGVLDAHAWEGGGPRPDDAGEYLDVMPPRMGGPSLPASERRTRHVRMPVSATEGAVLDAWAAREGRPLAELLRERGLRAASRSPKEPIVLAPNQYDELVERIANPPAPNARLRAIAKKRYGK